MWSQKFSKLRRQPPSTWALLHKHLITLPDPSASIFPDEVWNFIKLKADSLSTCTGFLVPCLLKTTSFVAAMNSSSNVEFGTNRMPLNLYTIFRRTTCHWRREVSSVEGMCVESHVSHSRGRGWRKCCYPEMHVIWPFQNAGKAEEGLPLVGRSLWCDAQAPEVGQRNGDGRRADIVWDVFWWGDILSLRHRGCQGKWGEYSLLHPRVNPGPICSTDNFPTWSGARVIGSFFVFFPELPTTFDGSNRCGNCNLGCWPLPCKEHQWHFCGDGSAVRKQTHVHVFSRCPKTSERTAGELHKGNKRSHTRRAVTTEIKEGWSCYEVVRGHPYLCPRGTKSSVGHPPWPASIRSVAKHSRESHQIRGMGSLTKRHFHWGKTDRKLDVVND